MTIPITHASASRVRVALDGRHGLSAGQVNDIVDTLLAAGLATADVSSDGRLNAAGINHVNALENEARRTCARLGISISASGKIDPTELAHALKGESVEFRLRTKAMLGHAQLID